MGPAVFTIMTLSETSSSKQTEWEPLLVPAEAAAYLGVHSKTAIRMARQHHIPAIRVGKHWRFRRSDLIEFAASQVESTRQPVG
jgi:excisionase family DNA binding protein